MYNHLILNYQHLVKVVYPAFLETKKALPENTVLSFVHLPAVVNTEITLIGSIAYLEDNLIRLGIEPKSLV